MTTQAAVGVLLAGEHNGLFDTLEELDPKAVRIVGRCPSARATLGAVRELCPDVILVEWCLPDMDACSLLRRLALRPGTRTVLVIPEDEAVDLGEIAAAGAAGTLDPHVDRALALKCLRAVVRDEYWYSRRLTRALVESLPDDDRMLQRASPPVNGKPLTPRETEVMHAVARGKTNRDIALELQLSEHTVKQHLKQVFAKLRVSSRVELVLHVAHLARSSDNSGL